MDWLDGGEDLLTAQREFDPNFGYFKRNAHFLGLIRLEFGDKGNRIASMPTMVPIASAGHKPKLLDQVRDVIRRKHYSIRTEQAYVDWIKRFIIYHNKRHPAEMAEEEVAQCLTHLAPQPQRRCFNPKPGARRTPLSLQRT